jgi:hypothetical protein
MTLQTEIYEISLLTSFTICDLPQTDPPPFSVVTPPCRGGGLVISSDPES